MTTRKGQDKLAEIQTILHETITGNGIVKAFGMELWEMDRFRRAARRLFRANLRSVSVQAISSPLMDAIGSVGIALLLLIGRQEIQRGAMTLSDFLVFIVAVFSLYDPVRKFAMFYNSFQQALGASEEIFRFMDAQDDVVEKKRAYVLKEFKESIRFEHVDFAYHSDGEVKTGAAWHRPGRQSRRGDRACRAERGREVVAGEFDSALLRCDRRAHSDRRPRPARYHASHRCAGRSAR